MVNYAHISPGHTENNLHVEKQICFIENNAICLFLTQNIYQNLCLNIFYCLLNQRGWATNSINISYSPVSPPPTTYTYSSNMANILTGFVYIQLGFKSYNPT